MEKRRSGIVSRSRRRNGVGERFNVQDEDDDQTEGAPCRASAAFLRGALLLQEKWVLLIVHSLLAGPIGFSELMRRGGVNTTTLTQRLNLLEHTGLLVKTIHSTMPPRTSYELTEAGRALKPVLEAITEWAGAYLSATADRQMCPGSDAAEGCGVA
jgi:DNA-binding HxlR family transcriptional regulator